MSGKTSRTKGARIEREAVNLLKDELGDGYVVERNLAQTRNGGADILINGFAIEVKGGNAFQRKWFDQAKEQAGEEIPVLAWRPDRKPWRVWVELTWPQLCQLIREADL